MSDIDQRLTAHARRWQSEQAPPRPFDPARSTRPPRPPAWRAMLAAAAAVAAVSAGGWLLTGHAGSRPAATPGPGLPSVSDSAVPWADLPARHATVPQVTVPASPAPSAAAGLRPCTASRLSVGRATPEGAAGNEVLTIPVRLAGDVPCRLDGVPKVELLDHGSLLPVPQTVGGDGSTWPYPVAVTRESPAELTLWWSPQHSFARAVNDEITIGLPDGSTLHSIGFGRTYGSAGDPGYAPLSVSRFTPREWHLAQRVSAYADVRVTSQPLRLAGAAGSTADFTVTLQSPRAVVFERCPDFTMSLFGQGLDRVISHQLNCTAIPHRDPTGRFPMLPAGTPVAFHMRLTLPDVSVPKFVWQLLAGNASLQTLGGTISVSGTPGSTAAPASCTAGNLKLLGAPMGAAAGTAYLTVRVLNAGEPCQLPATPTVELLQQGVVLPVPQGPRTSGPPVTLADGGRATLRIGWSVSHSCARVDADETRVLLADGTFLAGPGFGRTTCAPGEGAYQPLVIGTWTPDR